jgi:hypothetical protein
MDEAVWFDVFFLANVTPLFYVETLADLEKDVAAGRAPETVVGMLAAKTPSEAYPNVHHTSLISAELLGREIEMSGRVMVGWRQEMSCKRPTARSAFTWTRLPRALRSFAGRRASSSRSNELWLGSGGQNSRPSTPTG